MNSLATVKQVAKINHPDFEVQVYRLWGLLLPSKKGMRVTMSIQRLPLGRRASGIKIQGMNSRNVVWCSRHESSFWLRLMAGISWQTALYAHTLKVCK